MADYYAEVIADALVELDAHLTVEQINRIAEDIDVCVENRSQCFAPVENPLQDQMNRLKSDKDKMQREYEERERIWGKSVTALSGGKHPRIEGGKVMAEFGR